MLFKHLQFFPELAEQVPRHVLKELCSVAQLDKCPEEDYTGQVYIHVDKKVVISWSANNLSKYVMYFLLWNCAFNHQP